MLRKSLPLILIAAVALGVSVGVAVFTQESEVPAIPGITTADEKPDGCVSCHKERPDINRDFRLSTYIGEWATEGVEVEILDIAKAAWPEATLSGKHPDVAGMIATQELPAACLSCHAEGSDMPLPSYLHLQHFVGGEENHFITSYGGYCTQCHAVNLDIENPPAGAVTVKTGKESQ
jgi:cytochrome c551/c552